MKRMLPLPTVWLQGIRCVSQCQCVESPSPSSRPGNLWQKQHEDLCNLSISRSLTLFFVFIFPTSLALCCCSTTLACVAKFVTVEVPQRIRDKQVHFHLQIANYNVFWYVGSVERQKHKLPLFLHRYTVNLHTTLSLQFVFALSLRHVR